MPARDWHTWWNEHPAQTADLYNQVGRTVGGKATGETDLAWTIDAISDGLGLTGREHLLDICCGNGLLSFRIAPRVASVVGVDYSTPLLDVARETQGAGNIRYVLGDATRLGPAIVGDEAFDAAYIATAIQHFDPAMGAQLLTSLRGVLKPGARLFVEGIPDADRLTVFYNTPERLAEYHRRTAEGTEAIGHWWTRDEIAGIASRCGFACNIVEQDAVRTNAHYRFDALLTLQ